MKRYWGGLLLPFVFLFWRFRSLSPYGQALVRDGFPESYAERLEALHERHPNWTFEPLVVTDLTWKAVLDKECSPGWNLVIRSKWASGKWAKRGVSNYTPYMKKRSRAYDSGVWYQASRDAVAYFMDPRNFLNESEVFMFETLAFVPEVHTQTAVERALEGSFMANAAYDGGTRKFSELALEVGKRLNLSPVFLANRLKGEQGDGTVQSRGKIGDSLVSLYSNGTDRVGNMLVWGERYRRDGTNTAAVVAAGAEAYNGYYNLFNMGACGSGVFEIRLNAWKEASGEEARRRYLGPWTSQEKALRGGALKVKERYVAGGRHTRYLQKFSVDPKAGKSRWRQYMQNIAAPLMEARNASAAYRKCGMLDKPFRFVIPVYADMPEDPCEDPADGDSVYSSRSED